MGRRTRIICITRESKALKQLRLMKGLSVRKLADRLGVSHTLVSHLELGRANISKSYVDQFLQALVFSRDDWRLALGGERSSQSMARNKLNKDCMAKIEELPEEKLKLLHSILSGL